MSKDIRSFFAPTGSVGKKKESGLFSDKKTKTQKKRVVILSDSDDDDEIIPPSVKKMKPDTGKNNSKEARKKVPDAVLPEPKAVRAIDIFGSERVKRSAERTAKEKTVVEIAPEKVPVNKSVTHPTVFEDNDLDFEETLMQLDAIEAKANDIASSDQNCKEKQAKEDPKKESNVVTTDIKREQSKYFSKTNSVDAESSTSEVVDQVNPTIVKKLKKTVETQANKVNPSAPAEDDDEPSWINDPAEKRRRSAIGYQRYLQREGPKNLGTKEIPAGKPDCLKGLVFVVTGVLDSMEREDAVTLIQECGGKVTSSVSKNTSYIVLGDDAGPSKVHKAKQFGTNQLDEDGLFDLIRAKSGASGTVNRKQNSPEKVKKLNVKDGHDLHHSKKDIVIEKVRASNRSQPKRIEEDTNLNSTQHMNESPSKSVIESKDHKQKTFSAQTAPQSSSAMSNSPASLLWVDKYRPTNTKQIIGQQGENSNVKKLTKWLENWHRNQFGGKKLDRPSPWARNDDGAFFKAALLSGPPGVGKTTSAHLVCKELGFDVVEFNASDTRSKRLLHEEVSELLSSKSLYEFFRGGGKDATSSKHVLIMDEVDGMAGNEDRGGIAELIQLIKNSKVPVICMCNDHNHQKIRSLTNHCFDLRFTKPRVEQIKGAMLSVCFKEGVKLSPDILTNMIIASSQDVRQILHHLSLHTSKETSASSDSATIDATKPIKNIKLGPWDVLKKVFSAEDHKSMTINDKSDLFFNDYSLAPLFVQENYLSVAPDEARHNIYKRLDLIASASDSICLGDVVDKSIRSKMAWGLLPVQAMYSSVIPGTLLEGSLTAQISFPSWLGKNSRRSKFDRLLQELHIHSRLSTSGNKLALNEDYLSRLRDHITKPLIAKGLDGIDESLNVIQSYHLLRTDIDSIMELSVWPKEKDPMASIESKVKAALTRRINKEGAMLPYSTGSAISKKKAVNLTGMQEDGSEEDEYIEEDEDDVLADAMIKAKKRQATKKDPSSGPSTAKQSRSGSSVGKTTSKRGNGKGKAK